MNRVEKLLTIGFFVSISVFAALGVFQCLYLDLGPARRLYGVEEKLAVTEVSFSNSTSLSLSVLGIQGKLTITDAIIKNVTGHIVQVVHVSPTMIPTNGTETTVNVTFTSPLASGEQYIAVLVTRSGGAYKSPSFTSP